jgi:hypothetical protein
VACCARPICDVEWFELCTSVVNADNKIVGIGYNGFPIGCSDDLLPWARSGPELETKYPVRLPIVVVFGDVVCVSLCDACSTSVTRK